jgi:glycosyltransferase involved in cell wall biosynthesis
MARIAVVHPHFDVRGGAELVCLNVLEAIQNDHDVVLFTAGDVDLSAINRYYQTDVKNITIYDPPSSPASVRAVVDERFGLFTFSLLNRHLRRIEDEFDLVISTYNEITTTRPSILYIHHPLYDRSGLGHDPRRTSTARNIYKVLCEKVAGISKETIQSSTVLSNSNWTAGVVNEIYDVCPQTVYPPVDTSEFSSSPLTKQEHGFVSIGRLSPDKNILRNIEIVERLYERGHDVHLHLIGPAPRSDYLATIKDRIDGCSFVSLDNELDRNELVEMINQHRYGLHGKEHEHFGLVVAELIAGGSIPFIPNSGGQREIVAEREDLLYSSTEEAVEKIDRVLTDSSLETDIRQNLPDMTERFGRTRFQTEINRIVQEITTNGKIQQHPTNR